MAKITSEDLNKNHRSPINLEVGDDEITWAIVQEYMSSFKKYSTVDKNLADKYKIGKGSSRRSSVVTTATAAPATDCTVDTVTPTAASAFNRIFSETVDNDLVDVLISQSLSLYEGVRSALMYLDKRAGVVPTQDLKAKMDHYIAGCKRTIQTEKQELAQKITERKDTMSVETFYYIAKEIILSDTTEESLFSHFFFLLVWNLIKCAENCAGCKINHILWNEDALVL